MHLKRLELHGFKSFAKKSEFLFDVPIVAIVGPNGSGKSNVVESIRFVLGEQSSKSMRAKSGSDLIFKGSRDIAKMSRASVSIVFDNTDRVFHLHHHNNAKINVDFDEVVITREVFADGGNKYFINGHEVRMKDVHELIGSVNIGASGHHIISQGEADRYLNASIKDRRGLIEEALGLKIYQYRLKESLRKLEKSEGNIKESEMLRREIAPHLRFLKRQVDKIEKAKHLRSDLKEKYHNYFRTEDRLIQNNTQNLKQEKDQLLARLSEIESKIKKTQPSEEKKHFEEEHKLVEKRHFIQNWQQKISENARELGKIEGMINILQSQEQKQHQKTEKKHPGFSYEQVERLFKKIISLLGLVNIQNLDQQIHEIKDTLNQFIAKEQGVQTPNIDNSKEIFDLQSKKKILLDATDEAQKYIIELEQEIQVLTETLAQKQQAEQESQRQYYEYLGQQKEFLGKQELLASRIANLNKRIQDRNEEFTEAIVLLGESELQYQKESQSSSQESISEHDQELARRDLERMKIRLEDMGGGSGIEVIKEYEETLERDEFLAREIQDVESSIESLNQVISELKEKLDTEFEAGIKKINVEFDTFFKLMFGGGSAELEPKLIKKRTKKKFDIEDLEQESDDEDTQKEYGIDIKVKLPRKKVSDLDMLSGGERSLTSIALLFALSQVNPPPFLVLDETDAALDEANSQRYGDMVEQLSKYSQLIVVTHNRETMGRAQTLFGVTLGRDDCSTLLSLRLEDAAQYAK